MNVEFKVKPPVIQALEMDVSKDMDMDMDVSNDRDSEIFDEFTLNGFSI